MTVRGHTAYAWALRNVMVPIVTGGTNPSNKDDELAYYNREFCMLELKWALENSKSIKPVVSSADADKISSFIQRFPPDLRKIGDTEFVTLHRAIKYAEIGINEIIEAITSQGGVPRGSAHGAGGGGAVERFYWLDNTAILDDECDVGDESFDSWGALCDKVKRNFKQGTGRDRGAN